MHTHSALVVREVDTDEELEQACSIRADAYYEEEVHNRFVGSFKKKFAEQEARCVRGRFYEKHKLEFACVVAIDPASGRVVGTADVRVPGPEEKLPSAYVSNVCVAPSARRSGVANALMAHTMVIAAEWEFPSVYVHVDVDNEAARALYRSNGFEEVEGSEAPAAVDEDAQVVLNVLNRRTLLLTKSLLPPPAITVEDTLEEPLVSSSSAVASQP